MSNVTLRNVCKFVTLRNVTAHARGSQLGRVSQGRRTTSQRANDYTGARTVVRSWRARRRAVAAARGRTCTCAFLVIQFRNDVVHYDLFWRRNEKRVRDSSRTEASTVPVRWMALSCLCGIETSDSRAFRVDAYISCGGLW